MAFTAAAESGRSVNRARSEWWPALPALLTLAVLFTAALAGAVRSSLQAQPLAGGAPSLAAWPRVLGDEAFVAAVWFTAKITLATTLLSIPLALLLAVAVRGRGWARTVMALPVLVPHLLVAAVTVMWLGPGGLVDRAVGAVPFDVVRDPSGLGIVVVYLVKEVPFLALVILASWDDAVAQREEAAAVQGAGLLLRLRYVVLPAVRGPLVIGALLVAAFVVGSFEVPLVVGPTSPDMVATYALRVTRVADLAGRSHAAVALLVATGVALLLAAAAGLSSRNRRE